MGSHAISKRPGINNWTKINSLFMLRAYRLAAPDGHEYVCRQGSGVSAGGTAGLIPGTDARGIQVQPASVADRNSGWRIVRVPQARRTGGLYLFTAPNLRVITAPVLEKRYSFSARPEMGVRHVRHTAFGGYPLFIQARQNLVGQARRTAHCTHAISTRPARPAGTRSRNFA